MGEIDSQMSPSDKMDEVEYKEGRGLNRIRVSKTFYFDWDMWVVRLIKKLFKKGDKD